MIQLGRRARRRPGRAGRRSREAEELPLAYLEQLVARLRKAGLVSSTRGAHGGYELARPAGGDHDGRGRERARGLDRADAVLHASPGRAACCATTRSTAYENCATKLLWTRVQGGIARALEQTTLAELVEFAGASRRRSRAGAQRAHVRGVRTEHIRRPTKGRNRPDG